MSDVDNTRNSRLIFSGILKNCSIICQVVVVSFDIMPLSMIIKLKNLREDICLGLVLTD
jgi:hypothetical protein